MTVLQRFFEQRQISRGLQVRILRYISIAAQLHDKAVQPNDVALLKLLSGSLRVELQRSIHQPVLSQYIFFVDFDKVSHSALSQLCAKENAVCNEQLSKGDDLFKLGDVCSHMWFLWTGSLYYQRPAGIQLRTGARTRRVVMIQSGQHFSDQVLWVPWTHRGNMVALVECGMVKIDAAKFREVARSHQDTFQFAQEFALRKAKDLTKEWDENGFVWDLSATLMDRKSSSVDDVVHEEIVEALLQNLGDNEDEEEIKKTISDYLEDRQNENKDEALKSKGVLPDFLNFSSSI
jgi:hypothetical protein